jgi:hypothetical protein
LIATIEEPPAWWIWIIIGVLVVFSGLFTALDKGILNQSLSALDMRIGVGSEEGEVVSPKDERLQ